MSLFFKVFRRQSVLILLFFSMELSNPLKAKFTPGVNNSPKTYIPQWNIQSYNKDDFDGIQVIIL